MSELYAQRRRLHAAFGLSKWRLRYGHQNLHRAHLRLPEDITGSAGELVALQLVDPNTFTHLDRALRTDDKGAHVLVVTQGVAERVAWPPPNVDLLVGKPVVVMGSKQLRDGSPVDVVALDESQ